MKHKLAIFCDLSVFLEAIEAASQRGFAVEAYSPFPIHGIEKKMNIPQSKVPWAALLAGSFGFMAMSLFQIWTSAVDWPVNIGGKPMISLPAFIPVSFEFTILMAALSTVFFMFYLNGMPEDKPPLHPRLTDDRFGLSIYVDGKHAEEEIDSFLQSLEAEEVLDIYDREEL